MSSDQSKKQRAMKIIPFLPSVLTLASIVCGVTAILRVANCDINLQLDSSTNLLTQACWLIFAAMVFDVLDGKVARAMDAVSEFGKELDSLADVISFGVAPAFIANRFLIAFLQLMDRDITPRNFLLLAGISVVFVLCAAMRLARYNVESDGAAHSHLVGLPTPAAAGFVVANILFFATYVSLGMIEVKSYAYLVLPIFPFGILVSSLLMVSRIQFAHLGNILTQKMHNFSFLVMCVFAILIVVWKPAEVFFIFVWLYFLWGLIPGIGRYMRVIIKRKVKITDDLDES